MRQVSELAGAYGGVPWATSVGRLMDQPSAYWWASLMLMAVMTHSACQQQERTGEPFNPLIPSGINITVMPLEPNMTDIAWLKCNNLLFRTITTIQSGIDFHLFVCIWEWREKILLLLKCTLNICEDVLLYVFIFPLHRAFQGVFNTLCYHQSLNIEGQHTVSLQCCRMCIPEQKNVHVNEWKSLFAFPLESVFFFIIIKSITFLPDHLQYGLTHTKHCI